MKGYRLPSLLAACLLAPLCARPSASLARGDEAAPPEKDAARLVRDLGSADFKVREVATRRLLEYERPPPALRAALQSSDAEVARRASRIIDEITRREEKTALGNLTDLARRGEIDRLIEFLVRRPKWSDEEACWQVVAELNGKLLDLEKEKYRLPKTRADGSPVGDFRAYARFRRPRLVAARRADLTDVRVGCFVARAEHIAAKNVFFGLLVSSRDTRVFFSNHSIILAGGPVEVFTMTGPILVCDGEVNCHDINGSLLLARGDVRIAGSANDCRIITAGSVQFLPNKVLDGKVPRRENVEIREHEPNPLGFVRWFDPGRVGVTVEPAAGGVRVKAAGKSFAAAGLRAGDLLTAIDGEAVKSPDDFRLLLRARLSDGGKMALAVRRAGKELTIPVRCKD